MEYKSEYDEEPTRSLSRMVYGHELWIGSVVRANGKISFTGDYGHHMSHDRDFPEDYGLVKIVDSKGNEIGKYEGRFEGSSRYVSFDDPGDDIITVYVYSKPVPWVKTTEGWFRGPKKDFKDKTILHAGGYYLIAKRVISKDGNPGTASAMDVEIMPSSTRIAVGEELKVKLTYEGKPMAGCKMLAYRDGEDDGVTVMSDENGNCSVVLDRTGEYMLYVAYGDKTKAVPDMFDEASYEATYTISVY